MKLAEPASPAEFEKYYELRWKILCAPWGQPRGTEKDPQDSSSIHVMALDDGGTLLAVGRLHFNNVHEAQVRFMAVDAPYQRRGAGKYILLALEQKAAEHGALQVVLNARETALGFYRKQGYSPAGPAHMLFNSIPHVAMIKKLEP